MSILYTGGGYGMEYKHALITDEIIEFSEDNLVICDIKNKEFKINGNILVTMGHSDVEELILSWDAAFGIVYGLDTRGIVDKWEKLMNKNKKFKIEFKLKFNSKSYLWAKLSLKPFLNKEGKAECFMGYIHDITQSKMIESELKKLVEFDVITKLPSKYYVKNLIDDFLKNSEKEKLRGALLMVNIDNFKIINDSFGHEEGDLLLEKVATSLMYVINEEDLICRYSGDEFLIFKPDIESTIDLEEFVINIKKIFENPFNVNKNEIYITVSIGVSIFPDNGNDFNTLLKNADTAMYRAKSNGKDEWEFFNSSISTELSRIYDIQKGLRTALQKEEMFVVFQPKVGLADSIVNGFEALLRWESKRLGFVSPSEFIPIAENTRLIVPIGKFVLEESLKKIKSLLDAGYDDFRVAINLSEVQLRSGAIINDFIELMDKYQVSAKYIEVEITESMLMKTIEESRARLQSIKSLGISIALDDFGTGYSSLNYLTKLPIDVLKIDRSFVMELANSIKSRCIVVNIINLSHELGICVIAEGVEELEQVEYLKGIYCDSVQGYYFSKPQRFDKIKDLLGKKIVNLG
jgi:diguanylate cyclase (GGDEF)-like protein